MRLRNEYLFDETETVLTIISEQRSKSDEKMVNLSI
jgi:hypothetical protein